MTTESEELAGAPGSRDGAPDLAQAPPYEEENEGKLVLLGDGRGHRSW